MILPGTVFQDLRYAARMLRRNLGFTAVAVLALALGIGVNTAVFTAYQAMVARPLQARDPGRIVNVALMRDSGADFTFSYPDYEAYRDSMHSFGALIATKLERLRLTDAGGIISQRTSAAESGFGRLGLFPSGSSNAEFSSVLAVSENYFQVLGAAALQGRTFDSIGLNEILASPSVLISENYWQKRFARDPALLGKTIRLNGVAVSIVGITPHDFIGTHIAAPDFWLPLGLEPLVHADPNYLANRENQFCRLFGRLAPGVGIAQAQAEMTAVTDRLRALHDPKSESAKPAFVLVWPGSPFPLPFQAYRGTVLAILLIMAAAGMVLLVACADVGSLQLARSRSRQNELRTRLSLGASRERLIRQLLTESALLGLLAGALALLFTWLLLKAGVMLAAQAFPAEYGTLIFDVTPNLKIFAYVFAISFASGILFGLAPAMESSRSALTFSSGSNTSPVRGRRMQDFLIAAQVALSLVLMIAGSMLIRSSINSLKMETGYDHEHVVDLDLQFPEGAKYTEARKLAVVQDLRMRLAALPGVTAITSARPPGDDSLRTESAQSILYYSYVQANYFDTLGVPLRMGRDFEPSAGQSGNDLILSESAVKQLWPGQNPIGRSLRLGVTDERIHKLGDLAADGPVYRIIGVARDTRGSEFDGSDSKRVYLPLANDRLPGRPILIRTQSDPAAVMKLIDPLVSSIDPGIVVSTTTLEEMLRQTPEFAASSLAAAIASTLGLFGLLLASMGIYGTVSYIVLLRTREVGIRMAIGAQRRDILRLILLESVRPVMAGLLVGIFLAMEASTLLKGVLYGLNAVDPISFAGVSALFLAIALLAAYAPARRAMHVDPNIVLRYE